MPTLIKAEHEWLKEHARQDEEGNWWCKETGGKIKVNVIARSIWLRPFAGGVGEVKFIWHLYCETHSFGTPASKVRYGEPIYEDELLEVL